MNRRRTISWLAICAALIALVALTAVSTTCGGGGKAKAPGVPKVVIADAGANEWVHTWDLDSTGVACALAVDGVGDIHIAGYTRGLGASKGDALLLKYDSDGNPLWQKTWGGNDMDRGHTLAIDESSNVYVAGVTESFGTGEPDACLLKYSSSGNLLWQRTWAGSHLGAYDYARAVDLDVSGSVYVAGATTKGGARNSDVLLLKYSPDGSLIWGKTWGGAAREWANSLQVSADGVIYVAGATDSFGAGERDVLLLSYSSDGDLLWARTWGGFDSEGVSNLTVDNTGDVYVAGYTRSFNANSKDAFLMKYSSRGSLLWQKTWGWSDNDRADAVAVDGNSNIYVAGELWREEVSTESDLTDSRPGRPRLYKLEGISLLKFSSYGDLLWERIYDGNYGVGVGSIALDGNGKVIVVGRSADTCGDWRDMSGVLSSQNGTETTPEGVEGIPEGTETIPEGIETEPEGVVDEGGVLVMKYDPS